MGLEVVTAVGNLVPTNPVISDVRGTWDDHMRLIKNCIVTSFPNISANIGAADTDLQAMANGVVATTWDAVPSVRRGVDGKCHLYGQVGDVGGYKNPLTEAMFILPAGFCPFVNSHHFTAAYTLGSSPTIYRPCVLRLLAAGVCYMVDTGSPLPAGIFKSWFINHVYQSR